jgi:DNA-binding beta-propeller fold protein YncE
MVCTGFRSAGADTFAVPPADSLRVKLTFSPPSVRTFDCTVTFPGLECGLMPLSGTGLPLPAPGYAAWGRTGTGEGRLQGPQYVAVGPSGDVYVADTASARVQRFTRDGVFVRGFGSRGEGAGQFRFPPSGLAVDGREHLYVLDPGNGCVHEFDGGGGYVSAWKYQGLVSPALALASDGDTLLYMLTNMSVEVRGPTGGTLRSLRAGWPVPEARRALAAGRDGCLVVSDPERGLVWVREPASETWAAWGVPCSYARPVGVALDADGYVYALDVAKAAYDACDQAARVWKLERHGAAVAQWGMGGTGSPAMLGAGSVAAGPDGCLYVADPAHDRVHRIPVSLMRPLP